MKRKLFAMFLAILSCMTMLFVFTGCNGEDDESPKKEFYTYSEAVDIAEESHKSFGRTVAVIATGANSSEIKVYIPAMACSKVSETDEYYEIKVKDAYYIF